MYDFSTSLRKIRERTVFLGKEWMYTQAVSSAQPQAATRYLLAAVAVMDDAFEAYLDLTRGTEAPKSATTLGKRIELLAREGHLRKPERMREIKELRNVYAHEADKDSNLNEALRAISDIEEELQHLGML